MIWAIESPKLAGFEQIIQENQLDPKLTLFVDDALMNVEGAIKAGLKRTLSAAGILYN